MEKRREKGKKDLRVVFIGCLYQKTVQTGGKVGMQFQIGNVHCQKWCQGICVLSTQTSIPEKESGGIWYR